MRYCITDAIVCLSDFNVIIILSQIDYNAKLLFDIASLFSLKQLIDVPTRLTCNSATTLNLIFISSSINVIECGVSDVISMSDHFTIHATLAISRPHCPDRISVSRNIQAWGRVWAGADRLVLFICGIAYWWGFSLYYLSYYNFWSNRPDYL